jgi:hypothetical protein
VHLKEDLEAFLAIKEAVYEAIEASGESGIPSGHLYAMLMGHMSLTTYNGLVTLLKESGKVTEAHHVLRAV